MHRSLAVALPLVAFACSFTNLDGFSGGEPGLPDGGQGDAAPSSVDAATTDALVESKTEGGASTDPYGDAVRMDAPTSWWRVEDLPGATTLHDEMGAHDARVLPREGKAEATIELGVTGAIGRAAKIGNTGGYFAVGDVFDFAGSVELALEAWVENDDPVEEYEGVFNKRFDNNEEADTGWLVYLHKTNRHLDFQFWDQTQVTGTASTLQVPPGFHHAVFTCTKVPEGLDYTAYFDGVEVDHNKSAHVQADTGEDLVLGYGWNGSLDEMAIYEHTLTPERVLAHYKAAKP